MVNYCYGNYLFLNTTTSLKPSKEWYSEHPNLSPIIQVHTEKVHRKKIKSFNSVARVGHCYASICSRYYAYFPVQLYECQFGQIVQDQ